MGTLWKEMCYKVANKNAILLLASMSLLVDSPNPKDNYNMRASDSGKVPPSVKKAENPKYKVGSHAIITADHMKGMEGAEATIVGAYDTTVYMVDYKPTTGGPEVMNHKWIIEEELRDI